MRKLIEYLGVLSGFLVLGASMALAEWLGSIAWLGWLYGLSLVALPIYLMIKVAKK